MESEGHYKTFVTGMMYGILTKDNVDSYWRQLVLSDRDKFSYCTERVRLPLFLPIHQNSQSQFSIIKKIIIKL